MDVSEILNQQNSKERQNDPLDDLVNNSDLKKERELILQKSFWALNITGLYYLRNQLL